jgi:hypothetical protein
MIPDPYIPEQVVDPSDFVGRFEEIENLYDLGKKVFSDRFASASPIEQRILISMASFDGNNLNYSEIATMSDTSKKKVGTFFSRLTEKDLVRKVERGQYELFHPLFKEYLKNFVIGGSNLCT